jgi:hypothetical protein
LTLFPTTKTFDLLKLKDKFHFITNADEENGLKQGCVLSPTLFSVLMNDLVNMLDGVGIGIDVGLPNTTAPYWRSEQMRQLNP